MGKKASHSYSQDILNLHNGVDQTNSPIVQALWFRDDALRPGTSLWYRKLEAGEPPLLVETYCVFIAAVQHNDAQTVRDCLREIHRLYPTEPLWIATIEGQAGAWASRDTEATAVLKGSGIPFFEAVALRFEASKRVKARNAQLREGGPSSELKSEQDAIIELLNRAYDVLKDCSIFEACRSIHELANILPLERIQDKLAASKHAVELAKKCGAKRYVFTGGDRLSQIQRLQEASEFSDDQKSKYVGDIFRELKNATTLADFAARTIDLLCRESFLRIPKAAFVRRRGSNDVEKVLKQYPADLDLDAEDMRESADVGYGCHIRFSRLTDPDGLQFFIRGLRYALQLVMENKINPNEDEPVIPDQLPYIVGGYELHDPGYKDLYDGIVMCKLTPVSDLIGLFGEEGVGKTLTALAIHKEIHGSEQLFETFNCSRFGSWANPQPDGNGEMDFFGAVKGAYTGQVEPRASIFERAKHGTVFMDEMGDLPLKTQGELLTLFQNRTYNKRGVGRDFTVDARLMVATNRPIGKWAEEWNEQGGKFRRDLWDRIQHKLYIPPLDDVPLQIPHVARVFAHIHCRKAEIKFARFEFDDKAQTFLMKTSWPGNLRKLDQVVGRAVLIHKTKYRTAEEITFTVSLLEEALEREQLGPKGKQITVPEAAPPPRPQADWVSELAEAMRLTEQPAKTGATPSGGERAVGVLASAESSLTAKIQRIAKVSASLDPEEIRTWLREALEESQPPQVPPAPVPELEPLPEVSEVKSANPVPAQKMARGWESEFVNVFRDIMVSLKKEFTPLSKVIPAKEQPYFFVTATKGTLPRENGFKKIEACFSAPMVLNHPEIGPQVRSLFHLYREQPEIVRPVKPELPPTATQAKKEPVKPVAPAPFTVPAQESKHLRLEKIGELAELIWKLLREFPYRKELFFKKETITSFYSIRTKPYIPGEGIFLDAYQGFKKSPLGKTHETEIERLFALYMELQELKNLPG